MTSATGRDTARVHDFLQDIRESDAAQQPSDAEETPSGEPSDTTPEQTPQPPLAWREDHLHLEDRVLDPTQTLLELADHQSVAEHGEMAVWATLARFVRRCIDHQQVYPTMLRASEIQTSMSGVESTIHRYTAAWRLLLADRREVEALAALAEHLPGDQRRNLASLEDFLAHIADAEVRRRLAETPFFFSKRGVHAKAAEDGSEIETKWMSALLRPADGDLLVRGLPRELEKLWSDLNAWSAHLGGRGGQAGGYRLGISLREPPADVTDADAAQAEASGVKLWHLALHLTPIDGDGDPTDAPIPAAEIWNAPGATLGVLGRDIRHRRETLMNEVRRAARLVETFTPFSHATRDGRQPSSIPLSTGEAFTFLRDVAIQLRGLHYDIDLPKWAEPDQRSFEMVMDLLPADDEWDDSAFYEQNGRGGGVDAQNSAVGLQTLMRFDWKVAVGGQQLTPAEFDALVNKQRPLVKHGDRWIEIDPEAVKQAAELLQATPSGNVTLGQALGSAYRFGDRANVSLVGVGWIGRLLEQSPMAKREDLEQPEGFLGTLRPYQLRGFQWLVFLRDLGLGGCLADDMGLGKTIQLTSLLQHEKNTLKNLAPTLLFAPTSVVGNWHRELARFAPTLKVHVHQGPERFHGDEFVAAVAGKDVVLTSYALAHRDIEDLNRIQWHRLALDEAQKIKNPTAAGSKAIRSLRAPHRVALTGTPIENHLTELWSIMDMLNPGLLGTRTEFRQRFSTTVEKQRDVAAADRLRKLIRPFVLRRQKTDPEIAASLPEKMEMKTYCPLTGEQAAIYQRLTGDMLGQIDNAQGIRRRGLILAILTRLKQVCDHPALVTKDGDGKFDRSGKCERLLDMLEEVRDEGESALVFTQYREMGDLLMPILAKKLGVKVHFLHGGVPQPKREEMVIDFQAAEEPQVFLLSLRAGGLGLNLTAASHVFHFDRWWNPAVENQATDRAHRIGQTKTVQVHKFITLGTVEERIDKLLEDKRQLADNIVGTGDDWLTDLSTSELRDYLSLDTSAITD